MMNFIQARILVLVLLTVSLAGCRLGYKKKNDEVTFTYWHAGMGISTRTFRVEGADPETFRVFDELPEFGSDKNFGYYRGEKIEYSDGSSFMPVTASYSKDAFHVFFRLRKIEGADSKSFEVVGQGPYGADKNDYYFYWKPIGVRDKNSFRVIDELNATDRNHYYTLSNSGDSLHINVFPIKDQNSFKLIGNDYSLDKYQVYFNGELVANADPVSFITNEYARGRDKVNHYYGKAIVKNPDKFRLLEDGYHTDEEKIYFNYDIVANASWGNFVIINQFWAKDTASCFFEGKEVHSIDIQTFKHIDGLYVKDTSAVYYGHRKITADPRSVRSLDKWQWIRDDHAYYLSGEKMQGIDLQTFKILDNDYSKDKNHVYFRLTIVKDADVVTFMTTDGTYGGQDQLGTFYMGERN